MQRHLKTKPKFDGTGPFGTEDKRNDAQMPGPTGPKTKARARKMRKPPFSGRVHQPTNINPKENDMTTFLTAIVPDPECLGGQFRKEIHGDNPKQLAEFLREWITVDTNYGASDIGSIFNVYRDGCVVGYLRYNGRFNWADPLLNPANHIEIE